MLGKKLSLQMQGLLIVTLGILLIVFQTQSIILIRSLLLGFFVPISVFGIITTVKRVRKQIEFSYQEIHTITFIIYLVAVAVGAYSFERLNYITDSLFFFFCFAEITFCNILFIMYGRTRLNTLLIRLYLGLFCGVAATVSLTIADLKPDIMLLCYGIVFIHIGISILAFRPVLINEPTVYN